MRPDQAFVPAEALKDSLSELAKHYATPEEEIARRGIMFVAAQPPLDIDNEVSRLWDRFLPGWRERSEAKANTGAPTNDDLLERIEAVRLSGEQEPDEGWDGEPDFVIIEPRVRPAKGVMAPPARGHRAEGALTSTQAR